MNTKFIMGATTALSVGITFIATGDIPANAQDMTIKVRPGNKVQPSQGTARYRRNRRPVRYVTLNLRNAPVRTALMQLFQKAGRDYSLANSVDGVVNMQITNKPFDEALRLIANNSTKPLNYFVDSGVYFIRPRVVPVVRTQQAVVAQRQEPIQPNDDRYLPTDPAQFQATQLPSSAPHYLNGAPPVTLWGYDGPSYPAYQNFGFPAYNNPNYGYYPPMYGTPFGAQSGFYYPAPNVTITPPVVGGGGTNIVVP